MQFFLQVVGGQEVEILKEFHVGRVEADLSFEDDLLSSTHAKFHFEQNILYVTDLASSNGTLVNKNPIEKFVAFALSDGDEIEMGSQTFKVRIVAMEHTETHEEKKSSNEGTVFESSIHLSVPEEAKEESTQFEKVVSIASESEETKCEAPPALLKEEKEEVAVSATQEIAVEEAKVEEKTTAVKIAPSPEVSIAEKPTQISEAPASVQQEAAPAPVTAPAAAPVIEVVSAPKPKETAPPVEAAPPAPPVQKTSVNEVTLPPAASPNATVKIKKDEAVKVIPKAPPSNRPKIIGLSLGMVVVLALAGFFLKDTLAPSAPVVQAPAMPAMDTLAAEAALIAADVASEGSLEKPEVASESVSAEDAETSDIASSENTSENPSSVEALANADIASESVDKAAEDAVPSTNELANASPQIASESVPEAGLSFSESPLMKQLEEFKKDYLLAEEFGIRSEIEILALGAIETHYAEIKQNVRNDFKKKRSLASEANAPKDEELFQKMLQISQREKEARSKLIEYLNGSLEKIF